MEKCCMHTYFLGGTSPIGFRTPFGKLISDTDYHTYIIKGGPGSGKSTFMKKIASTCTDEERDLYLCSSDPDSADAVVLKKSKVIFVDGTAPHVFEPQYPGTVQEILNIGDCWDSETLKSQKNDIIAADTAYSLHHVRCRRYLSAAASVIDDSRAIAESALDTDKLDGFVSRFAKKIIPYKNAVKGKILFRQISAVTPKGYITIPAEDDDIYLLNDPYSSAADRFLREFSELLSDSGFDCEISECYISGYEFYEHLRIPELNIALISANNINKIQLDDKVPINFMRFYNKDILSEKKLRLKFNLEAADELVSEAVSCLVSAKAAHDKLEEFYTEAVDFSKVNALYEKYTSMLSALE